MINDNCQECVIHKQKYNYVLIDILYYPELGVKYLEAKQNFNSLC